MCLSGHVMALFGAWIAGKRVAIGSVSPSCAVVTKPPNPALLL